MTDRWEAVDRWRTVLRRLTPDVPHLSPAGARVALDAALDALDAVPDHLDREAPAHTVLVAASTVFTAPLEWAAVLLARGGAVTVKAPRSLGSWFEQVASATDLPLRSTTDRAVVHTADRIVAMGSDATLDALRAELSDPARLLGFGHRFALAWWTDPAQADALALDLVLHDGRGCLSPVAVFSPLPDAGPLLADALDRLGASVPRGPLSSGEHARIRERSALAQVLGRAHAVRDVSVFVLPSDRFVPYGLPRGVTVHPSDVLGFRGVLATHGAHVGLVGSDAPLEVVPRTSPLGQMQRPPLDRLHDGVDWLRRL